MKKIVIFIVFISILVFPNLTYADGPYLNIPPTNAFDKIHSDNGTISAVNYSMPFSIHGFNGINVTSNNNTHILNILNNASCLNTTLNDQSTNRTLGAIYHNISGHTIFLTTTISMSVQFDNSTSGQGVQVGFYADKNNPPVTETNEIAFFITSVLLPGASESKDDTVTVLIPDGFYYKVDIDSTSGSNNIVNIVNWYENTMVNICGAKGATGATGGVGIGSLGTYNSTLANDAIINTNGFKINYINGTGNPVHVQNSNTGQQVNVTISSGSGGSFTTRTINLNSSSYRTILDNNTGTVPINVTSKPTNPQFVQTISSGNIPTDTTDVQDYTVVLTVGGKNSNGTTSKAISVIPTRNGVEVDSTRSLTVTNGNFWETGTYFGSSALSAGDKIGLKMWCSSSPCTNGGGLDYRYATVYIVPRQFVNTNNGAMSIIGVGNLVTLSGAIPGVTYSLNPVNQVGQNAGGITDPILGLVTGTTPNILTTIKGQNISELTQPRFTTNIAGVPTQQAASNLISVSFPKFIRVTTLS